MVTRDDEGSPATRDRVERAALALFVARGYTATSLREIAQSVGVSVPALYYHFASKDELLRSVTEPLLRAGDGFIEHLRRLPRAGFARRALEGYYDLIVEHFPIYRLVSTDPAVRSHPVVGRRAPGRRRCCSTYWPDHPAVTSGWCWPPPPPVRCAARCACRASTRRGTGS